MIELNILRSNRDALVESLRKRNWDDSQISKLDDLLALDKERRESQQNLDRLLSENNALSKQIGAHFAKGEKGKAEEIKSQMSERKQRQQTLEKQHSELIERFENAILEMPNILHTSVLAGIGEEENEIYKDYDGELPVSAENTLPHWELAEKYDLMSLPLGVKLTGAGFPVFKGNGARMQRALINYFLDRGREAGYTEFNPPLLVNEDSARGTGQLPDKDSQMYRVEKDDFYLIPTAEVPLTNLYRDEILEPVELPIKLMGYTPCFRREAGSYGAHVKGLNRVHQFDKVEIVQMVEPEKSMDTLQDMCAHVGDLLESLGLPYRILKLCGGDTGFAAGITYDFEVYSVVQQRWLEVSSVSNFFTFQSNRMLTRYKTEEGKKELVHTLNGSALALPRILASLWELNQSEEGIRVPDVLHTYMGGMELIS